jgi:hypothetical protein
MANRFTMNSTAAKGIRVAARIPAAATRDVKDRDVVGGY